MAQTLAQEIKDRKAGLKGLEQALKEIDTTVEKVQRLVKRLRSRKRKLPSLDDLLDIINLVTGLGGIEGAFNMVLKAIDIADDIFRAF